MRPRPRSTSGSGSHTSSPSCARASGEIAAAAAGELPQLVELSDIRGDLHCHTTLSDGRNTLEEMAEAARERGYAYLAITDHSASHGFGDHVTAAARCCDGSRRSREYNEGKARLPPARRLGGQHPARRLARLRPDDLVARSTG